MYNIIINTGTFNGIAHDIVPYFYVFLSTVTRKKAKKSSHPACQWMSKVIIPEQGVKAIRPVMRALNILQRKELHAQLFSIIPKKEVKEMMPKILKVLLDLKFCNKIFNNNVVIF